MGEEKVVDVKPVTLGGEAEVKVGQPIYKRRKCLACCGISLLLLLLVIIIVVILVFTVFKVKDPDIKVTKVKLLGLQLNVSTLTGINLQLDLSIHNPNKAEFTYTNSTSTLYYDGTDVGEAPIPAGKVGSNGYEDISVVLHVEAQKILEGSNFTTDLAAGVIPVSTTSRVDGRLNVLNIYKHHAVSSAWCDVSVFVKNATLEDFRCRYSLKM